MKTNTKVFERIKKIGLPEDFISEILLFSSTLELKRNEQLIDVGDLCNQIYFVLEGGFISKYYDSETETYRTVNFYLDSFQPFMTSVDSYFKNNPTAYQLVAIKKSTVIAFDRKDTDEFLKRAPHFSKYYYNFAIDNLIKESHYRSLLLTYSSDKFYQYLMAEHPEIIQNVPSKYIAEFMGISQEWLSKLKTKR